MEKAKGVILEWLDVDGGGDDDESGGDGGGGRWGGGGGGDESNVGGRVPDGLAVRIPGFHPGGPGSTPGQGARPLLRPATSFACSARACQDGGDDEDDERATNIHAMGVGGRKRPATRPNRDSNPGPSD